MKIKLYNYYFVGGWENGIDTPNKLFNDYKYVIRIAPNITKNVIDFVHKENDICWHLITEDNYKLIIKKKILRVKEDNLNLNKKERLYLFLCKNALKDFYTQAPIRAMAFSLSKNRGTNHNILLRIDLKKTNISKIFVDPDAPGFNAVYTFEPISVNAITNIYKLEFPKDKLLKYNEI